MHSAVQTIRRIARYETQQRWISALGLVKSVQDAPAGRPGKYSCTVELRETAIVLPEVPIATSVIGTVSLPRENDLVVVLFPGGDLHAAVVLGRLYTEHVAPPEHRPGESVTILPGDETSSDRRIELRIKTPGDGTRKVALTLDGSVKVELTVDGGGITLQAQDTRLSLQQSGSSDGKAQLAVGDSSVTIEQSGDIKIEASGTLTLKASKIELNGDASGKIAGQTVELN
jgi:phage baseplate assembly protein gpV